MKNKYNFFISEETSAKTGSNIREAFKAMVKQLYDKQLEVEGSDIELSIPRRVLGKSRSGSMKKEICNNEILEINEEDDYDGIVMDAPPKPNNPKHNCC